jgi:histidine triad (HIT) family protein
MPSIFTRIINREIPSFIIDETDKYIAILAKDQMQPGHTLVIPKQEIDNYLDMSPEEYADLQVYAQSIAQKLKKAFPDKSRIIMNIVGFEVPHIHIHLIPANSIQEAFMSEPEVLSDEKMAELMKFFINQFYS